MRRNWAVSLLASLLVAGIVIAVAAVAMTRADTESPAAYAAAAAAAERDEPDQGDAGGGPPPWAHANGQGKGHRADKAWQEAWHQLTPARKRDKMDALTRAHRQGMATWAADCVAAAGGDRSERAKCVKPLPPGLAKRQP